MPGDGSDWRMPALQMGPVGGGEESKWPNYQRDLAAVQRQRQSYMPTIMQMARLRDQRASEMAEWQANTEYRQKLELEKQRARNRMKEIEAVGDRQIRLAKFKKQVAKRERERWKKEIGQPLAEEYGLEETPESMEELEARMEIRQIREGKMDDKRAREKLKEMQENPDMPAQVRAGIRVRNRAGDDPGETLKWADEKRWELREEAEEEAEAAQKAQPTTRELRSDYARYHKQALNKLQLAADNGWTTEQIHDRIPSFVTSDVQDPESAEDFRPLTFAEWRDRVEDEKQPAAGGGAQGGGKQPGSTGQRPAGVPADAVRPGQGAGTKSWPNSSKKRAEWVNDDYVWGRDSDGRLKRMSRDKYRRNSGPAERNPFDDYGEPVQEQPGGEREAPKPSEGGGTESGGKPTGSTGQEEAARQAGLEPGGERKLSQPSGTGGVRIATPKGVPGDALPIEEADVPDSWAKYASWVNEEYVFRRTESGEWGKVPIDEFRERMKELG